MARNYKQGKFTPTHPEKYAGDLTKIWYRSSWELHVFEFLDTNPYIKRWSSESIEVPYFDRSSNKMRKYFPDLWVEYVTKDGEVIQEIIEIKPKSQVRKPNPRHKHYISESLTHQTNLCKWEAAKALCDRHGIKFRILTEGGIFA